MYKNTLSVLALTAGLGIAVAQDAPAPAPAAPAAEPAVTPAAAPAADAAIDPAASVDPAAAAISPEKEAKIMKQMAEFEEACTAAGLDSMGQIPTAEEVKTFMGVIDSFMARTDLEEEVLGQFLQMKVMMSVLYAQSAADLETLKADLEKLIVTYPALASEIKEGITELFAKGAEGLFEETAPVREQMAMQAAMMQAAAAAEAEGDAPAPAPAEEPAPAPAEEPAPAPAEEPAK